MTQTHPGDDSIAEAAYLMWLDEGRPEGRDQEHWLRAVDALTPPRPKKARKAAAKPRQAKAGTKAAAASGARSKPAPKTRRSKAAGAK